MESKCINNRLPTLSSCAPNSVIKVQMHDGLSGTWQLKDPISLLQNSRVVILVAGFSSSHSVVIQELKKNALWQSEKSSEELGGR